MADDREDSSKDNKDNKDNKEEKSTLIGETVKKLFTAGVSAAFMTEESVRAYLAELKLPKEILNVIIQGANKSKDDITQRVSKEIIGIVQKIDFVKEASKFAETHKFKVTAEIEILKKDR
ncbi:MAG: hypothetical protein COT73_05480 [Bdellovibrio sp. CG10_big_fil_rev_8_21_14_0_10_47_8]|nr:MAG: hypothetical protein COT73_05480 [Bdellovibrio sp. CG10_big_fil_rev_8_21_14_0_10_47_8]